MNDHLRAQSRARLATVETRLLELERHLDEGRERDALEELCELRAHINALFAALLANHLHEQALAAPRQSREVEALLRQLLDES